MGSENGVEYVFVLADGTERYEIVFERSDIYDFAEMHRAVIAMPLWKWEQDKRTIN